MTRRLVLSYLAMTIIVLAILEIPLAVFYSQREEERFIVAAERDAVVLASFYEDVLHLGSDADDSPAMDYAERTTARIIVVDTEGISVLDTDAEPRRDFSTRPEVETALTGVRSGGIRNSETLGRDLLYVAVPVASGGTVHGALRLTIDAHEVNERIQRFWIGLLAMAAVVLIAVAGVGWAIARSVTKPIRQLQESARRFADGDLRARVLDGDAPDEIKDLGDAMNQMATRLDQLINAQRAFVSDASHQLRTPLTALRLRLENLEASSVDAASTTEIEASIDEIERLSSLVNDLLHLARAEQHPVRQVVDAAAIVADRIETWNAVASERDIELRIAAGSEIARPRGLGVLAIPGALEQVLDNTIDNALQATPAGGRVEVAITPGPDRTTILVRDHGPGLSDADKEHALERFWRGDSSTPGTGLGLAIVQVLTEASGGELLLTDSPGGGLTVSFRLETAMGNFSI